jgi:tape measure domain-containing protein
MDEAVRIEITGKIDGKIARSIRDIAGAALEADTALDTLREAITAFTPGQHLRTAVNEYRELRNEINRVKQTQQTLVTANKGTAGSFKDAATSADRYAASLRKVDAANTRTAGSLSNLRGIVGSVVGLFGGIFAVKSYVDAQDALTGLQNKIRSLTPDLERQAFLQNQLFEIANRTRTGVASLTDGFVRYSKALRGASDQEVLRFTETLTKLLSSAGRTASEVNSVVVQLGQALTSGRLQGDEFRALSENLPREALQAIADVLDTNVENLKKLGADGKITSEVLREAFGGLADFADEQFARTIPTISSALEVLNNKFIEFTGNTSGAAAMLASAIMGIGDNLNIIIPLVVAFAAAWALVKLAAVAREFYLLATAVATATTVFAAANLTTIIWVGAIGLLVTGLLAAAYAVAVMTGNAEVFEGWVAGAITKAKEWAASLGAVADVTGLTGDAQALLEQATAASTGAMQGFTGATNDNTKAANDNAKAMKAWSSQTVKAIEAVAYSYNQLSAARKAALAEGASKHYAQLTAAGGSSGSFTAVPTGTNQTNSFTKLPAFARGGSIQVGGRPGIDRNVLPIRVSRGERVDISTREQQRREGQNSGPPVMVFNVVTPDAESFRRSRGQIASDMIAALL